MVFGEQSWVFDLGGQLTFCILLYSFTGPKILIASKDEANGMKTRICRRCCDPRVSLRWCGARMEKCEEESTNSR